MIYRLLCLLWEDRFLFRPLQGMMNLRGNAD